MYLNLFSRADVSYPPLVMEGAGDAETLAKTPLAASDATTAPKRGRLAPPDSRVAGVWLARGVVYRQVSSGVGASAPARAVACARRLRPGAEKLRPGGVLLGRPLCTAPEEPLGRPAVPGGQATESDTGRLPAAPAGTRCGPTAPSTPYKACTAPTGCSRTQHPCCLTLWSPSNHATGDISRLIRSCVVVEGDVAVTVSIICHLSLRPLSASGIVKETSLL